MKDDLPPPQDWDDCLKAYDNLKPSARYVRLQQQIANARQNSQNSNSLRDELKDMFAGTFELRASKSWDLYSRIYRALQGHDPHHFWDHVTIFRDRDNDDVVFVPQPYGKPDFHHQAISRLEDLEMYVHEAHEWGWYYPGRSLCYMIYADKLSRRAITRALSRLSR